MDFWQVLKDRHSVRDFDPTEDVSPAVVDASCRLRSRRRRRGTGNHGILRGPGPGAQGLAAAAYGQEFIAVAPVAIVVCADAEQSAQRYGQRGRDLYCLQDTAAAVEHILLAAVASGLGACWVGAFDERRAARVLNLPHRHRPVAILPIGKPAGEPGMRTSRRSLQAVTSYVG